MNSSIKEAKAKHIEVIKAILDNFSFFIEGNTPVSCYIGEDELYVYDITGIEPYQLGEYSIDRVEIIDNNIQVKDCIFLLAKPKNPLAIELEILRKECNDLRAKYKKLHKCWYEPEDR